MAYSVTRSMRELQRLLDKEGLVAQISKPLIVEGGLSPPPSKIYPGTKCYMVTISISSDLEFHGYGPTPTIARYATIRCAYDGIKKLLEEQDRTCKKDQGEADNRMRRKLYKKDMHTSQNSSSVPVHTGKIKEIASCCQNSLVSSNANDTAPTRIESSPSQNSVSRCGIHNCMESACVGQTSFKPINAEDKVDLPANMLHLPPPPTVTPPPGFCQTSPWSVQTLEASMPSTGTSSLSLPVDLGLNGCNESLSSQHDQNSHCHHSSSTGALPLHPLVHPVSIAAPVDPPADVLSLLLPSLLSQTSSSSVPDQQPLCVPQSSSSLPYPLAKLLYQSSAVPKFPLSSHQEQVPLPLTTTLYSAPTSTCVPSSVGPLLPSNEALFILPHPSCSMTPVTHLQPSTVSHLPPSVVSYLSPGTHLPPAVPQLSPGTHLPPSMVPHLSPGTHLLPSMVPHLSPGTHLPPSMVPHISPGTHLPPSMVPHLSPGTYLPPSMVPHLSPGTRLPPSMVPYLSPGMHFPPSMVPHLSPGTHLPPSMVPHLSPRTHLPPSMVPHLSPGTHLPPSMVPHLSPGTRLPPSAVPHLSPGTRLPLSTVMQPHTSPTSHFPPSSRAPLTPPSLAYTSSVVTPFVTPPDSSTHNNLQLSSSTLPDAYCHPNLRDATGLNSMQKQGLFSSNSITSSVNIHHSSPTLEQSQPPSSQPLFSYLSPSSYCQQVLSPSTALPQHSTTGSCESILLAGVQAASEPSQTPSYCGSIKLFPYHDAPYLQLDQVDATEEENKPPSPLHSPQPQTPPTPDSSSQASQPLGEPTTPHELDLSSSCPFTPSSCDSEDTSSCSPPLIVPEVKCVGEDQQLQRAPVREVSSSDQLGCDTAASVDPYDYQTGPDPLQFTVRLPKIASMQDTSPDKPNWKSFSKEFVVGQSDRKFFCNQKSQCNSSNSAVLKLRQQGYALALSSDSSEEEDLEEYGSDLDQSLAYHFDALHISDGSLGDQEENANSLPAHFLFDSNKDEYLTQESLAGDYTGIESCDVLKRNGFHKLLKAKACPKLCVCLPSEGSVPE